MSRNYDYFITKFDVGRNTIYGDEYWTWSVRPIPTTLGAGVLSLKRPAEHFSDISPDEGSALSRVLKIVESALDSAFKPDKINYIMLMMVDFQVHFHIIPRYKQDIVFNALTWIDHDWPTPPGLGHYQDRASQKSLDAIRHELKSHLPSVIVA